MARQQNAPHGLFIKDAATITTLTGTTVTLTTATVTTLTVSTTATFTPVITANGGITINKTTVTPSARVAPGTVYSLVNSTGVGQLVLNTTGTTWVYLNGTSVQA